MSHPPETGRSEPWRLLDDPGCIGCGICAEVCPVQALAFGPEDRQPRLVPGRCTACDLCRRECPVDTIVVVGVDSNVGRQGR